MLLAPFISRHPRLGRWIYASVAAFGAAIFTAFLMHRFGPSDLSTNDKSNEFILWMAFLSFIAGLICWPRKKRGAGRMTLAGILTVAIAFLLFPLSGIVLDGGWDQLKDINTFFQASVGMLVLGSIFTFGIPYGIGIGLSFLFIDVDYVVDKKQNQS